MKPTDLPFFVLVLSLVILYLAVQAGDFLRKRVLPLAEEERSHFSLVLGATLTLLGMIIGFSFSMAITQYNQRKNYEEAEANAISTAYLRADLLPAGEAAKIHGLLKQYLDQRILFYTVRDRQRLAKINADTLELHNELWSAVQPAAARPSPIMALVVSGMNDVLSSRDQTQAAWWNRIPTAAWALMLIIAAFSSLLIGYGARRTARGIFLIVPVTLSIAFFLIADIDSTREGTINVVPQDLVSLSQSLHGQ